MIAPVSLVDFLRARYAEAREAAHRKHAPGWGWSDPCYDKAQFAAGPDPALCTCPQRQVLADLDSKLRIVDMYSLPDYDGDGQLHPCGGGEETYVEVAQLLALPFACHADYQEGWRP